MHRFAYEPDFAPQPSDMAQCATWPAGDFRAGVRCWTASGHAIQCCGHGLLSAAASWQPEWPGHGELLMNGSTILCEYDARDIWLGFSRVSCHSCSVPSWATALFGTAPVTAAQASGDDGYLILAWPDNTVLDTLAAPGAALAKHTHRALIATCATTPGESRFGESIRYRYFAPQHGVDEDCATGSALRILADYWESRGIGAQLSAWQQSPRGGWLHSRISGDQVWIGGAVAEQVPVA